MRIGTFSFDDRADRIGVLFDDRRVLDAERALEADVLPGGRDRRRRLAGSGANWQFSPDGLALHADLLDACRRVTAPRYLVDLSDIRARPPVSAPGKILAAGRNYLDHLEEGRRLWAARGREVTRPPFPSGFVKLASAVVGDGDAIEIPPGVNTVDYEIELAVVIGTAARDIDVSTALTHVAGYTVANDVAARSIQLAEMEQLGLLVSKNFPTFAPLGPWLTTTDEIPDPQRLTLDLWVDSDRRQHASTADMLFSVAELVADWSRMGLDVGDVLLTGTPAGVAMSRPEPEAFYLRDGNTVTAEIAGIGRLRNPVRDRTTGRPQAGKAELDVVAD